MSNDWISFPIFYLFSVLFHNLVFLVHQASEHSAISLVVNVYFVKIHDREVIHV